MSCVLNIAGKNFDIDSFLLKSGLVGFTKKYKDESSDIDPINEGRLYSFLAATISDASLFNFENQVSDAIVFLKNNKENLEVINTINEIEYATLNFLVGLKSVSSEYFSQYMYFPKELTNLCGNLSIGIEITLVDTI